MPAAKTVPALTAALLLLVACAGDPASAPPPAATTVTMACGLQPVTLEFSGDDLVVRMAETSRHMVSAISGSGARYQAPNDETSWLWNKGDTATLVLDGQTWPLCLEPGALEKPFEARGNEPFWHLSADNGVVSLTRLGEEELLAVTYQRSRDGEAVVLDAPQAGLRVRISETVCRDTMSGMPYPRTVSVEHNGEGLSGCGGSPQRLLQGADWEVIELGGAALTPSPDLTLHFDSDNRVSGRAACNRYTGGYALTGEGLSIARVATTKMACEGAQMTQEQRFLALLAEVDRFDVGDDASLRLIAADKDVIRARLPER